MTKNIKIIKLLRDTTGAPFVEIKDALKDNDGDYNKTKDYLLRIFSALKVEKLQEEGFHLENIKKVLKNNDGDYEKSKECLHLKRKEEHEREDTKKYCFDDDSIVEALLRKKRHGLKYLPVFKKTKEIIGLLSDPSITNWILFRYSMNYTEIPMEDWFDKHLKEAYYESKTYDENAEEDDDDFEKELDLEIIITELQLIQDLQEVPEDKYAIHGEIEDIVLLLQDFDDKYQLEEQTETIIAKLRDIEDAHDLDKKVEDVIAQLHLLETPDDGADKNNAHFNTDLNPKWPDEYDLESVFIWNKEVRHFIKEDYKIEYCSANVTREKMLKIFISSDLNGKTLDCLLLTDDGSREGEIVDVITLEELFYSKNEL